MIKNLLFALLISTINLAQTPIYKFEFNNSRTDASGNHTFSTTTTSSFVQDRFGNANQAIQIDFLDPISVNLPNIPLGTTARSISFWASFRNAPATSTIFLFDYGSPNMNQAFRLIQRETQIAASGRSSDINTNPSERFRYRTYGNNWYHYVMTYDGTTCQVYRNGNLYINAATPTTWNTVGTTFQLGSVLSQVFGSQTSRNVAYDDLEVYNSVLTASQIQNMYTSQVNFDNTGLVAYFPFDGNLNDFDGEHAFSNFPNAFPGGTFVTGYSGQGVSFDLGQGFMNTSLANSMNNNDLTICYWQKRSVVPNTPSSTGEVLVEAFGSFGVSERKLTTDTNPQEILSYYRNATNQSTSQRIFLKDVDQWHHVAIQFVNSGSNRFLLYFIDGEFVNATPTTASSSIHRFNNVFSIGTGTQLNNTGTPDVGKYGRSVLDELYIFNRALTVPEIMAIRYQNASTLSNHSFDKASVDVNVFPNPFTAYVEVKSELIGDIRYEVIDLTGKRILHGTSNQPNFIIDHLDQLHKGIYLLQISDSNGNQKSQKIVK